jgi:hypothetical protein
MLICIIALIAFTALPFLLMLFLGIILDIIILSIFIIIYIIFKDGIFLRDIVLERVCP